MHQYGLKPQTIADIQKVFSAFPQIGQVIIYGSRAKGNFKQGSDIDLTMVPAKGAALDLTLQFQIEEALEALMLPDQFDLSLLDSIDNPGLKDHIDRGLDWLF